MSAPRLSLEFKTPADVPRRPKSGRGWVLRAVLVGLASATIASSVAATAGLEWQTETYGRSAALSIPAQGKTGFTLLDSAQTGVTATNRLSPERAAENQIRLNGSGFAAGDIDGDGWCDLYFCGLESGNHLFRNLGQWRFEEVTEGAGVACPGQYSTGAVFADLEGDGDLDLLVNGIGAGTRCFLNDGSGRFNEAIDSGLARRFGSMSMALGDIDGDGALDLYVANYRTSTIRSTGFAVFNIGGKRVIRPEDRDRLEYTPEGLILEHGEIDILYRNVGPGRFSPVRWTDGTFMDEVGQPLSKPPRDWGLTVSFRDLNGDSAPDLYVANDFHSPDRIWLNDGKGRFRPLPAAALRHTPTFSMAVDFADIDRDGYDDFLSLDMLERTRALQLQNLAMSPPNPPAVGEGLDRPQIDRNTLQHNRGDGTYADIAEYAGLAASGWSWSLLFLDVDLDGYEDVLITTGNLFNSQDLDANAQIAARGPFRREMIPRKLLMYPPLFQPRLAFRNDGNHRFHETGAAWGFSQVGVAHGFALADLDNDGDLDVIVNNLNAPAGLYRNETTAGRIAVRLRGATPNTQGIGAKIKILGGPAAQSQEMICGGRYLSCDQAIRVFAAAPGDDVRIEVAWRSGKQTVIKHASANRLYEIDETSQTSPQARLPSPASDPLFEDVSNRLQHTHHEEAFDDFIRQPLLPKKLSQLGPGVSWFDCNGDGWEDLIIASGRGGEAAQFINDQHGGFTRNQSAPLTQKVTRDQTSILAFRSERGSPHLLAGSANFEDGQAVGSCVREYDLAQATVRDSFPGQPSSTGPLALADPGDGQGLALFAGGRSIPGRYPEPASSFIFRKAGGAWVRDSTHSAALANLGLVSGAVWSDLDDDGRPELLLASDWGTLRAFKFHPEGIKEVTKPWGLDRFTGWWTAVAVGDFDEDGRMDILGANWGLNSPYQASAQAPLRLHFGDLDGNGALDLIEAHFDSAAQQWFPTRDLNSLRAALPFLGEKFTSHRAYSEANLVQVFGQKLATTRFVEVNTLASMLFLNRGQRFEAAPLPTEAQFAPSFGLTVADFNGDGHEDVFIAQNFFATEDRVPRQDAGLGLLLTGDGKGGLKPVPGQSSGLRAYGEQRGSAAADYDHDGRVDLVVGQNGAATKLFRNVAGKPGLRIRLVGTAENPDAIGASLRFKMGDRRGPRREIHFGSGYWSQDAPVQVLGLPPDGAELEVRWAGGKTTTSVVPPGTRAMTISSEGDSNLQSP